ncbi:MAG TPA: DUF1028 domain-containing protein [Candidatus Dormibacteraeota bacterium]|nr:DUF1028 domain-containing protein [Candidatus Dormibacteraeota bacterium]
MTYSIVALDRESGELGVAVQSHYFQVGPTVPWALAGVGAVATQSRVNVSFGPLGLDYLRAGYGAAQTLKALLAGDPEPYLRQVAVVDASGAVAVHTGEKCIAAAGHKTGDAFSVQANLMEKDTVWDAMAHAFTSADGRLAERMMAALEAAEAEGGDVRGKQSAAMLVVSGNPTGRSWEDRVIDLRVEDSSDPLGELKRLLRIKRSLLMDYEADRLEAKGEIAAAMQKREDAVDMAPEIEEHAFWAGVRIAELGDLERGCTLIARAVEKEPRWKMTIPRLVAVGRVPADLARAIQARLSL